MANDEERKIERKVLKIEDEKEISGSVNDGMNTPVPDITATQASSASEAALYRQADNPLGDPHKV